jgi:hypothetical protein
MTSAMLAAKEGRMEQLKVTDDHRVFFFPLWVVSSPPPPTPSFLILQIDLGLRLTEG